MEHLFLIRHGKPDIINTGLTIVEPLSNEGRQVLGGLASRMGNVIAQYSSLSHYLASSPVLRAEQSARVIADELGIPSFEKRIELEDNLSPTFFPRLLKYVDSCQHHGLVTLVGHIDLRKVALEIGDKKLGLDWHRLDGKLRFQPGYCIYIDFNKRTILNL